MQKKARPEPGSVLRAAELLGGRLRVRLGVGLGVGLGLRLGFLFAFDLGLRLGFDFRVGLRRLRVRAEREWNLLDVFENDPLRICAE
jgi:hypothetical protein